MEYFLYSTRNYLTCIKNDEKSKYKINSIIKNIEIMKTLEDAISGVKAICVLTE